MTSPGDEALLKQVLGERVKLLAYIRSIVRRRDLAEDIFQDLCVLVLQKRSEAAAVAALFPWLRIVARNLAMNAVRKHANRNVSLGDKVHALLDLDWRETDGASGPLLADALDVCLERLGTPARAILRARYTEGESVEQVAQRLGRPPGSLRTTISRIHRTLAECILQRAGIAGLPGVAGFPGSLRVSGASRVRPR